MTSTSRTTSGHPVHDWADVPGAIVAAEQAGAIGIAYLLRELYAGRIALLPIQAGTSGGTFKKWQALTAHRPAVALIADDDYQDLGPNGFPVSERAVRWCRAALLHAAGAQVEHYRSAVTAALIAGRMLIVECSTATLPAWTDLVRRAPLRPGTLIIRPRDGGLHPVMPARSEMQ